MLAISERDRRSTRVDCPCDSAGRSLSDLLLYRRRSAREFGGETVGKGRGRAMKGDRSPFVRSRSR